jgi:hypothetical protein
MAMLAAGLARRVDPRWTWASFSAGETVSEREAREILAARGADLGPERVPPGELESLPSASGTLSTLVVPDSIPATMRIRLHEFLRLPPLLQRLAARGVPAPAPSAIVLAHVEALPGHLRHATLENADVHSILRREGVTLIATYSGQPPVTLLRAFELHYRLESGAGSPWTESRVTAGGSSYSGTTNPVRTLSEWWQTLGLDPSFLSS